MIPSRHEDSELPETRLAGSGASPGRSEKWTGRTSEIAVVTTIPPTSTSNGGALSTSRQPTSAVDAATTR